MPESPPIARKSGKILLRMPTSLHASLVAEAAAEGVSLNQLILSKLSLPLAVLLAAAKEALK